MSDGASISLPVPALSAVVAFCGAPRPSGPERPKVLAEHGGPSATPPPRPRNLPPARVAAAGAERSLPKDTPHA